MTVPGRGRVTVYGASQQEAAQKLGIVEHNKQAVSCTVEQYVNDWLAAAEHRVAASTHERYARDLGYVVPILGARPLAQLDTASVTAALIAVAQRVSGDAARKAGLRLRQVLKYAVDAGDLAQSPARSASLPRGSPRNVRLKVFNQEQAHRFIAAASGNGLHSLYVVALDTGARLRELFALTWGDWDSRRKTLSINKALKQDHTPAFITALKTRAGLRTVRVSEHTATVIEGTRGRAVGSLGLLFHDSKGGYLNANNLYARSFYPLLEKAGLPKIRFHDLRHTCATLLLSAGVDVLTVSKRLGHASPSITLNIYGHVLPSMEERAAKEMEKILQSSIGD